MAVYNLLYEMEIYVTSFKTLLINYMVPQSERSHRESDTERDRERESETDRQTDIRREKSETEENGGVVRERGRERYIYR